MIKQLITLIITAAFISGLSGCLFADDEAKTPPKKTDPVTLAEAALEDAQNALQSFLAEDENCESDECQEAQGAVDTAIKQLEKALEEADKQSSEGADTSADSKESANANSSNAEGIDSADDSSTETQSDTATESAPTNDDSSEADQSQSSATVESTASNTESSATVIIDPPTDGYAHCTESNTPIEEHPCTQYYDGAALKMLNTAETNKAGEIYLSPLPKNFSFLERECKVCKTGDTLRVTDGEMIIYRDNKWGTKYTAPFIATIGGADPIAKVFYQKFSFDIDAAMSGNLEEYNRDPHRFHIYKISLWNEDKSYKLEYSPSLQGSDGSMTIPTDGLIEYSETGGGCTHPACM